MAAPIAEELEWLLNPLPRAQPDPEDDPEDATAARVVDKFEEGVPEEDAFSVGHIRKGISADLLGADKRYHGRATSRKALEEELWREAELSDEQTSSEEEMTDEDDLGSEPLEEDVDEDGAEMEEDEDEEGEMTGQEEKKEPSENQKKLSFSFQAVHDFEKFAEGMDEIGSEDEEEDISMEESGEDERSSDESFHESKEETASRDESKDGEVLLTFSKDKVVEEVAKGKAVKNQIALWDQLLEGRIKLQKALLTANQLPQPDTFLEFKKRGGQEFADALKNNYKALKALLRSLVDLQDEMLHQYSGTRHLVDGQQVKEESDKEISSSTDEAEEKEEGKMKKREMQRPPKRKLEMEEYPEFAAKRFAEFRAYRNSTLQKWHDKTKLASGKMGKGFSAFERSVLTQIDHILMDKERLLRRTHTKRSAYRVLGKLQQAPVPLPEVLPGQKEVLSPTVSNAHLKDQDEEIFDDDDFYHQLLRELIERKTSSLDPNDQVAMGRQWLAIQKLRSKIRKKVDTKASKGRKIRYHVHSKLVSFMAPIDHCTMNDDARTELYRSLFGQRAHPEGGDKL